MRSFVALVTRLVPHGARRCFEPALADLDRRWRARRRRGRAIARPAIVVWFAASVIALAIESRRLHRRAPHATGHSPKGVDPMILHDIRFAVRMLWKSPGLTGAALVTLTLGIGAAGAIFSIVQHVLLRPLPYPAPSRVMDVNELYGGRPFAVSAVNLQDWRARNHSFASLGAYNGSSVTFAGDSPERVTVAYADEHVFAALDVRAMFGRTLTADDTRIDASKALVISERLWRRRFGSDPSIIGRSIVVDGSHRQVVGVMPAGFEFPEDTDAWLPLVLGPDALSNTQRGAHYLSVVGRLRDGVTLAAARNDLADIERDLAAKYPRQVSAYSVAVTPLLDALVVNVKQPLLILLAAVFCVLLIACVNVANLLLARATTRTAEIAVRAALGAARVQVFRQLCIESLVLALFGGIGGILLGSWAVRVLLAISPADLPRADGIGLNESVLLFSLAISVLTGLLFGVVPAAFASRADLTSFLKEGRRGGDGAGGRRKLRQLMVGAQVAIAVVLLTGAGLALRSFDELTRINPGFDPANVLTFNLQLPSGGYPTFDSDAAFFREYTQRLQAKAGVVAAGAVMLPPLAQIGFGGTVTFPGRAGDAAEGRMEVRPVTPGYFETLRIPLRSGRLFAWTDVRHGAGVVLVSEAAARKYWPGQNPIGQPLRIGVSLGVRETAPREIVGVVADVHVAALDEAPPPVAYVPLDQYASDEMTMVVRTDGDPISALPIAQGTLAAMDRTIAISRVRSLQDLASRAVSGPRFRALLLGIFALTSLLLAAVGIYGTLAFSVSQRSPEIGLRLALGARGATIMQMVVREGLLPVCAGLFAGLAAAALVTRSMRALLFNVSPVDPLTFAAVATGLVLTALAACYVPTRRAIHVDPVSTLRG
jgi:putative ABC transport system permease protein